MGKVKVPYANIPTEEFAVSTQTAACYSQLTESGIEEPLSNNT